MGVVVLTNKTQAVLSPEEMMQNLKNNIVNFKKRPPIDDKIYLNKKIKKIAKYPSSYANQRRLRNLNRKLWLLNQTRHTREFETCDINEDNISYKSHIKYIENEISPILKESMGTTFTSKDGKVHKITVHWLTWAKERGHLKINIDNF